MLPPRAAWPEDRELFLPLRSTLLSADVRTRRDNMIFQGIARLADGVTREQAEARMRTIAARLEQEFPESRKGWSNGLVPLREYMVEPELRVALFVLLARRRRGAADWMRQPREPHAHSRREPRARNRRPPGARRQPRPPASSAPRGKPAACRPPAALSAVLLAIFMVQGLRSLVPPDAPSIDQVAVDGRVLAVDGGGVAAHRRVLRRAAGAA